VDSVAVGTGWIGELYILWGVTEEDLNVVLDLRKEDEAQRATRWKRERGELIYIMRRMPKQKAISLFSRCTLLERTSTRQDNIKTE